MREGGTVNGKPVGGDVAEIIQEAGALMKVKWPQGYATWEWARDLRLVPELPWHAAPSP
jgi:hypothetical protein